jgi:hypothetical protein
MRSKGQDASIVVLVHNGTDVQHLLEVLWILDIVRIAG